MSIVHAGSTVTTSNSITIGDAPLSSATFTGTLPTNKFENQAIGAITGIASFVDTGDQDAVSDYTATINWGDSSTSAGTVVLGTPGVGSTLTVNAPTHTYTEEGTYTITVSIVHAGSTVTTSNSITILDPAINSAVFTGTLPTGKFEGQAIGTISRIATFVDPGDIDPTSEYLTTINWGDSTTSAGSVVLGTGADAGKLVVNAPTHTYSEEGSYTISVTITQGGATITATSSSPIAIADLALTSLTTSTLPTGKTENNVAITSGFVIATFTDPGDQDALSAYSAVINWGDGTTSLGTVNSLGSGNYNVTSPAKTYTEGTGTGTYTVNVTLQHDSLVQTTPNQTIAIADATIVNTSLTGTYTVTLASGGTFGVPPFTTNGPRTIATFTDNNPNAVASDFSYSINWGTGASHITGTPSYTFVKLGSTASASTWKLQVTGLTFNAKGTYSPIVTVTDVHGNGTSSYTFTVAVNKFKFTVN